MLSWKRKWRRLGPNFGETLVKMMARREGGGEEGGIDGRWGDEDGREHRSLVVGNDEQG